MITFLIYLKYQDGGVSTEKVGEVWPTERKGSFLWRRQKRKKKHHITSEWWWDRIRLLVESRWGRVVIGEWCCRVVTQFLESRSKCDGRQEAKKKKCYSHSLFCHVRECWDSLPSLDSTPFFPEDRRGGAVLWLSAQNRLGQKQHVTFEMLNTFVHAGVSSRCKWLVQTGAWVELVARFFSLFIRPQRLQRQRDSRLCFLCDLKEFSGHLRAGREGQATPKTSVNRSRLSGDSWSTLLIRSGLLSGGAWPLLSPPRPLRAAENHL